LLGRQFYLRGTLDDWRRAREAYQRAVSLDKTYAAAWAGLASSTFFVGDYGTARADAPPVFQEARDAADKAVALGPEVAAAYRARGLIRLTLDWNWEGMGTDFQHALSLEPENPDAIADYAGYFLRIMGRKTEELLLMRRAAELDPLSAGVWSRLGRVLMETGDQNAARAAFERAIELAPSNGSAGTWLAISFLLDGGPPTRSPRPAGRARCSTGSRAR
jgi:tetratricopeptide (TPR) repeat protein